MAAASPNAVASSASAMPGATTARLVVCDFEMPMKLFMMPQTVPNRPTKGAVAPIVARPLRQRGIGALPALARGGGEPFHALRRRAHARQQVQRRPHAPLGQHDLDGL